MTKSKSASDTALFYDLRGENALKSQSIPRIPIAFRTPYSYVYQRIKSEVPLPARALEVGVGTGIHLLELAIQGYDCTGIDISHASLLSAQNFFTLKKLKAQFLHGSIDHQELENKKFNLILTAGTLYYLSDNDFKPFLQQKLLPEGTFIAVETNGSNFFVNKYRAFKSRRHQHRDEESLNQLLKIKDIIQYGKMFKKYKVIYFDCLTLLTVFFKRWPKLQTLLLPWLKKIDFLLLNYFKLHFLAFKIVLMAKGPKVNL
ncbi:MAG: class I SAM-dependent methyltransferase [Bdellovibrionales bacterium]|nr:class I SAM-dependent methyltransferase [Bdellovibrionales bacterium]